MHETIPKPVDANPLLLITSHNIQGRTHYERLSRRVYYPVAQRNPRFGSNLDQLLVVGSGMTQYNLRFHYLLVLRWHPHQEKRGFRVFPGFHLTHTSSVN